MGAWDGATRRLSEKWGEKRVTAVGMRAVLVGWRALFARVKWPIAGIRFFLAPLVAPIAGFVLARRRTSAAIVIFILGCILPRAWDNGVGLFLIAAMTVVFSAVWLLKTRDTKVQRDGTVKHEFDFFRDGWSRATIGFTLLVVIAAVALIDDHTRFHDWVPAMNRATDSLQHYALPVATIVLATLISWSWAKLPWRIAVAVIDALIIGGWTFLGTQTAWVKDTLGTGIGPFVAWFGSMWWGIIVMVLVTTALGYNIDVADLPARKVTARAPGAAPKAG
jgi:hypothetical protein